MDGRDVQLTVVPKSELYSTLARSALDRSAATERGRTPPADTVIRLRGLPYQAQEPDIRRFFEGATDVSVPCARWHLLALLPTAAAPLY